jgi:hypothetical protein
MAAISNFVVAIAVVLSSLATVTPVNLSTHSLAKRDAWTFPGSACPDDTGDIYTGPSGRRWKITCGQDTPDSTYSFGPVNSMSFESCIQQCGRYYPQGCRRVGFQGGLGANDWANCYMKSSSSQALTATNNVGHKTATYVSG